MENEEDSKDFKLMHWYLAHTIFFVKLVEGKQDEFPVWENVFLVRAKSSDVAFIKADRIAKKYEKSAKEMFYDEKPAFMLYKGIRKLVGTENELLEVVLKDGEEITYSHFEVKTEKDVERLVNGEEVNILHIE